MTQLPRDPTREFVTAPMILHGRGGWDDGATLARCTPRVQRIMDAPSDMPDWIRGALPQARRAYLLAGGNPALACDLDATIYLLTASLEQPLGSEWTRIYLHVAFEAIRETQYVEIPDDDWVRDASKPLSRYEQQQLDDLRGKIRQAQIRHAKKARGTTRAIPARNESEAHDAD